MSDNYDWTRFQIHSYIAAKPEQIFRRWATASGLESFFIRTAVFQHHDGAKRQADEIVAADDEYHWQWWHKFELSGMILAVAKHDSITFTFGEMKVTVSVHPVDSGTLVKLEQFDIPCDTEAEKASNHLNCRSCWVFYLANLKSICETGHDLRQHDPNRADCASVHFLPPELKQS